MSVSRHISDIAAVKTYANSTSALLEITSVASRNLGVSFPAFLTDFSQNFDSQWNTEDVFGRADPIATYQGTKRVISLGFDIIAGDSGGAKKNLQSCRDLIKMVYPVYSGNVLSKPPLVRVKFANLIVGAQKAGATSTGPTSRVDESRDTVINDQTTSGGVTKATFDENKGEGTEIDAIGGTRTSAVNNSYIGLLGWISGLSWKPNLEMGMFATGKKFFPKVISISLSFNVLHEHTPSQNAKVTSFPFKTK